MFGWGFKTKTTEQLKKYKGLYIGTQKLWSERRSELEECKEKKEEPEPGPKRQKLKIHNKIPIDKYEAEFPEDSAFVYLTFKNFFEDDIYVCFGANSLNRIWTLERVKLYNEFLSSFTDYSKADETKKHIFCSYTLWTKSSSGDTLNDIYINLGDCTDYQFRNQLLESNFEAFYNRSKFNNYIEADIFLLKFWFCLSLEFTHNLDELDQLYKDFEEGVESYIAHHNQFWKPPFSTIEEKERWAGARIGAFEDNYYNNFFRGLVDEVNWLLNIVGDKIEDKDPAGLQDPKNKTLNSLKAGTEVNYFNKLVGHKGKTTVQGDLLAEPVLGCE